MKNIYLEFPCDSKNKVVNLPIEIDDNSVLYNLRSNSNVFSYKINEILYEWNDTIPLLNDVENNLTVSYIATDSNKVPIEIAYRIESKKEIRDIRLFVNWVSLYLSIEVLKEPIPLEIYLSENCFKPIKFGFDAIGTSTYVAFCDLEGNVISDASAMDNDLCEITISNIEAGEYNIRYSNGYDNLEKKVLVVASPR